MKKVLILTVTAGNAHNACAKSMQRRLEQMGGVEIKIVDLLKEYSSAMNYWIADSGYNIAVSKFPKTYDKFFEMYKNMDSDKRYKNSAQSTALSTISGLMEEIIEYKPDVIYATHFYAAIALSNIKYAYNLPCKTIITCLDYELSPFWESAIGVDYFVLPNEDFIEESLAEGFKREQLLTFGLPVDDRTLEYQSKENSRKVLGLDKDILTIMVMFGGGAWSGGFKIFKDLVKAVEGHKVQIIMINGKNKEGFEKIEKMEFDENIKVVNVGFTDKIPLYMSAADIILNKCGGASVTEMINKELPMLITEKIPMQEKYNLIYLKEKGIALSFKNAKELKNQILKLMNDKHLREEMSRKCRELKRAGLQTLAEFIINQPRADYSQLVQEIDLKKSKRDVKKAIKEADKTQKKEVKLQKKKLRESAV